MHHCNDFGNLHFMLTLISRTNGRIMKMADFKHKLHLEIIRDNKDSQEKTENISKANENILG